jgi:CHASE2 domain-containing sensor protein
MDERPLMSRVTHALVVVLAVCVGVRVAAWVIEPVLPLLGALVMFAVIGYLLTGGPRFRG